MAELFVPPRCPNRRCAMHRAPTPGFYQRRGCYRPACRRSPVPRFSCKACSRSFSRQTFRLDCRDRRPECNERLFALLTSGVGLRQSARLLRMGVHAVQQKFRKLARGLRLLNRNLLACLPPDRCYLLDELESFEQRSIQRLTVPVLIEKSSLAVLATGVAPIRRVPRRGSRRQRWLANHELLHGRRRDRGRQCVHRIFGRLRRLLGGRRGTLLTDEKALYAAMARDMGPQLEHWTVPGSRVRNTFNPLFPINLTDAMLRDNNGRLRRRSWLVSKQGRYLALQLELFAAYRNWHRPRTNADAPGFTPGMQLGLVPRRLAVTELLAWRQDWRERSIHPASGTGGETVRQRVA